MSGDSARRRGGRRGCGLAAGGLVVLAGLALAAAIVAYPVAELDRGDVVVGDEPIAWEVRPGESAAALVARMVDADVVFDSSGWALWLRLRRPGGCLQAGHHELPHDASARELFRTLCEPARAPAVRVTVPEGTNVFQLADLLAEAGLGERDRFVALALDPDFAARAADGAPTLEGYLGPDTFDFRQDADPESVLLALAEHGERLRAEAREAGTSELAAALDLHAVLTVASIVEEEARVSEERPLIARVIYNRLARGMPIQCDPTCVYGPATYALVPTRALCRDPRSTHSTYVLPGLPPTPITNPGRAALEAALRPAEDPDVLYFVAMSDGSGRHVFANTLAEHERNVDLHIRGRRR